MAVYAKLTCVGGSDDGKMREAPPEGLALRPLDATDPGVYRVRAPQDWKLPPTVLMYEDARCPSCNSEQVEPNEELRERRLTQVGFRCGGCGYSWLRA